MKIGILQTGHAPDNMLETLGDTPVFFERLLAGHDFTYQVYPVCDGVFPDSSRDCDAWLITGSKFGAYEDHDWIPPLEDLIRRIYAAGVPLVGICFGHQIIAQALGGRVEKFPGGWSVGATRYTGPEGEKVLNAWHQDQVTVLPRDAKVLAASPFCPYAALSYGPHVYTVQPHPEYGADAIDMLLRERAPGVVPPELIEAATKALDTQTTASDEAERIAAVLKGTPL
ncbi:type 1 glutamine amidotransferase [Pseudooceanicola marinus]|uniref:type 1 glutamine amidotransferase n=1 Tax=Pseudooceanicola marinus TaxID=396013 RepID=UPI001C953E8F|nr:type 1 glutamine amidotransferase [Pseudooceanicola marinus]MBY5973238.1 type 1 glutamine amidotransferase [Ferrimonas balearica]MCA1336985.1 type 1 glutamine amidotransferase [Pseudooceanicola marinus]